MTKTNLCALCSEFNLASITSGNSRQPGYKHHASYTDLRTAAQQGCGLCFLLHWSFINHGLTYARTQTFPKNRENWRSEDFEQYHLGLDAKGSSAFFLSITVTVLTDINIVIRSEAINGLNYSRYTGQEPSPDMKIWAVWLSLTALRGATSNIAGRQLTDSWDVALCHEWLKGCSEEHQRCRKNIEAPLPTRLVRIADDLPDGYVRLVNTKDLRGRYVTLSYCWGASRPPSTVTDNLESHLEGIAITNLPPIYRDALEVTRALGFHYLWIDALCIVQDDPSDWQVQCGQMADIYENSALTINAPAGSNTDYSFLTKRTTTDPNSHELQVKWPDGSQGTVKVGLAHTCELQFAREELNAPFDKRSWVVQEYVLSPRMLSFGSVQMYFACQEGLQFENLACKTTQIVCKDAIGLQLETGISKDLFAKTVDDYHQLWYTTTTQYTKKYLTWEKDNLPALSGLARRFHRSLKDDTYVAGLWKLDIMIGLSWHVANVRSLGKWQRYSKPAENKPPSWSWISTDEKVNFFKSYRGTINPVFLAEFVSIHCEPVGEDPYGEVKSGILKLRGRLHSVTAVEPTHDRDFSTYQPAVSLTAGIQLVVRPDRKSSSSADLRLHDRPLLLLPLWYYYDRANRFIYFGLVLEEIDAKTKCFKRVGCVNEERVADEWASIVECDTVVDQNITIL